jgi:hypothetical protein
MQGFPGLLRPASILFALAMTAGIVAARADDQSPLPTPTQRPGDVLRIPGAPPIQMPPGVRVFGPNGPTEAQQTPDPNPRRGGPAPTEKAPADKNQKDAAAKPPPPDLTDPAARKKVLDDLFERLGKATDDTEAKFLTTAIERVWLRSGSDTADLLMTRAGEAMQSKDWTLTQEVLDKVVTILPDWAEGWNKRATARFSADDYAGAMEDIAHTLALEPRHFDALAGLGFVLQKIDMNKRALQAFRKALDVNPRQAELRKIVEKMAIEVDGRDI